MSPASPQHWLVKQEPEKYSWEQFLKDKKTTWDGVRNYQARNNLRAMKKGDLVFFYRSVTEPAVVGLSVVTRSAYPDPTATEGDWSAVDLKPIKTLGQPVPLSLVKTTKTLADMPLIRQSRLSVMPVSPTAYGEILKLSLTQP
ncbi:MAG: EVE domain-containing protein [Blastochloris sp.]|nr:EVE domain-containing protein [Blastochloris sp.]